MRRKRAGWLLLLAALVLFCLVTEAGKYAQKQGGTDGKSAPSEDDADRQTAENGETQIRVLLKTDDFASLFHEKITVTSSADFTVTTDGKKKAYQAGKRVSFSASDRSLKGKEILIEPSDGKKLQVLSIKRNAVCPSYRGTLQISWEKDGLLLKNTLGLEQYLYAVIPSELPTSSDMEALKAQAVAARTYAVQKISAPRYEEYQADLDDSTSCQVYNNVPEDKRAKKAVKKTAGMILADAKGNAASISYYSTSWGYEASDDLSDEESFLKFIQDALAGRYDSQAAWYRWEVTVSVQDLSARVTEILQACYRENPSRVLTQTKTGGYRQREITPLGTIQKIRVEKREKSGLIEELVLVGDKNVVKVCSQDTIRRVLGSVNDTIYYNKNASGISMASLPSAAFYVAPAVQDGEKMFCLIGGGFGHGEGMSQSGACRMAVLGKSCREILMYYFPELSLASEGKS